ncbi:MAG: CidA/LrgA family protein [Bacteroides sp.]|nr:CidA/LrgA family protein [Bacteroides sp.]
MIIQFGILFTFLMLGEFIVWLTNIPIPSSIIGMLLLTFSLHAGWVKPSQIERLAMFLTKNMGFFFVPAGVGLMNCYGILSDQWLPIVIICVVSTILVIFTTGWAHRISRSLFSHKHQTKH